MKAYQVLMGCAALSLCAAAWAAPDFSTLAKTPNADVARKMLQATPPASKPPVPPGPDFGPLPYRLSTLRGIAFATTQLPFILELPGPEGDDQRILGGVPADASDFPWQVALLNASYGTLFCGGTHIGNGWIVSAAHCFVDEFGQPLKKGHVLALSGTTDLLNGGRRSAVVTDPVVHEKWDAVTKANDIAVLRIAMITGLPSAKIVAPGGDAVLLSSGRVHVSGWGTTTEQGSISTRLLKVTVPVAPRDLCINAYPGKITDQICAGTKGLDSCQGDSGGPLTAGTGRELIGVVSFGRGCGRDGFPGVYTRINSYRDWIRQKTGL